MQTPEPIELPSQWPREMRRSAETMREALALHPESKQKELKYATTMAEGNEKLADHIEALEKEVLQLRARLNVPAMIDIEAAVKKPLIVEDAHLYLDRLYGEIKAKLVKPKKIIALDEPLDEEALVWLDGCRKLASIQVALNVLQYALSTSSFDPDIED